jgi:hypothetical protein
MQYLNHEYVLKASCKDMTETETALAEKSSWDQANRGEKLDLVWRNRKKISQNINDYLCLPFFLLTILCLRVIHFIENPIYVFLFWELRSLSPNFLTFMCL